MRNTLSLMTVALLFAAGSASAVEKHPFKVGGLFTETCSCHAPCPCEMIALMPGCVGVGAFSLTSGEYDGHDLSGVKAAYAVKPGEWVRLYIQAKPEQREAAAAFFSAVYRDWGKLEAVKDATVDISGTDGKYTVTVNGGKIMRYETEVVLGADKKTAITHTNVKNTLNTTVKQGLSVSATFRDDNRKFELKKGRNAYFNDVMNSAGEI